MRGLSASLCIAVLLPGLSFSQRFVTNGSFEQPVIPANAFRQVDEDSVNGWDTSHPMGNFCNVGAANCRPIEYWRQVFLGVSAATGAGAQWAEINSSNYSMIYQPLCLRNGESFSYSFVHRGRDSATIPDVAQFRIGIPGSLPAGSEAPDTYSFPIVQVSTTNNGTVTSPPTGSGTINAPTAAGNGWVNYSGTYTYTGTTRVGNVGFVAVSTANGNISVGNLFDHWQMNFVTLYELISPTISNAEGTVIPGGSNTPANRPAIRITGNVTAPLTIRVSVVGGTATIGNDYSLSIPFQNGNTTTFHDFNIPVGVYGTSSPAVFLMPFSTSADNWPELDETIDFNVSLQTGTAVLANPETCGATPVSSLQYTILNDDIYTAANVTVSGKVYDTFGRPAYGVGLVLADTNGNLNFARSNVFGNFFFRDVVSGESYVLVAESRSSTYAPVFLEVGDSVSDIEVYPVNGAGASKNGKLPRPNNK
ncbi:MAG: carboxypeptidase regulatory-like domain-containing protein [Acidobacteria bacterium]|nr:MAG: carboxypeptidase regulatory-like domain-containing protein [Acidobacteriota bacterium]REK13746.1 MAG: carboxypeptidase regulatory-like domain-containing protein [Acidobacteriota bacterium]